jgi:hypothetical protein
MAKNFAFCGGLDLRTDFAVVVDGFGARRTDNLLANIRRGNFFRISFGHVVFKPAHWNHSINNFFDNCIVGQIPC